MKVEQRTRLCVAGLACAAMGAMLLGSGCATSRGILDVQITVPKNPASGRTVSIVRVTDRRQFQEATREPSIPSLKGNEIRDKAITSRAIARKRDEYGKAMGDILLPEGRTVEDLVWGALTRSFREAGFRVIDGSEAAPDKSTPVEADIDQFWAWTTPGLWAVSLQFEARIKIKGDVPSFKKGETVRAHVEVHAPAATGASGRAWLNTINQGVDALVQ